MHQQDLKYSAPEQQQYILKNGREDFEAMISSNDVNYLAVK